MFDNKKYITKGISETIPQYLQNILWYLVETMEVPQKDCLQVFKLGEINESGKVMQKITHTQEQPEYIKVHKLPVHKGINAKVFAINDGDHSTMLLAEEY